MQVGVVLGVNFPGGGYSGWKFSSVGIFQVGIVWWESFVWQFYRWEFSLLQTALQNCQVILFRFSKSRKINQIVKMPKRKAQAVSDDDTAADILICVENPNNDKNFN